MSPVFPAGYGNFGLRCPEEACGRVRVLQYMEGRVVGELTPPPHQGFLKGLLAKGGVLKEVGDALTESMDLALLGRIAANIEQRNAAYMGAATQMRTATQVFVGCVLLSLTREQLAPRGNQLFPLILRVKSGDADGKIRSGTGATARSLFDRLYFLTNLGDTAAHVVVTDPNRIVPATKSNLEKGFEHFEKLTEETVW